MRELFLRHTNRFRDNAIHIPKMARHMLVHRNQPDRVARACANATEWNTPAKPPWLERPHVSPSRSNKRRRYQHQRSHRPQRHPLPLPCVRPVPRGAETSARRTTQKPQHRQHLSNIGASLLCPVVEKAGFDEKHGEHRNDQAVERLSVLQRTIPAHTLKRAVWRRALE